jgi:hypothetical protein
MVEGIFMSSPRYLSAVYRNFVRRLERAVRIADLITQGLMIGYFAFLAYDNFDEPALFYPYIAIIAISLFGFVYTLLTHGRKDPQTKKVTRVVVVGRWVIRGLVLSINLILFFVKGGTDTEKILWAVSVIFLIFQILLDIITREIIHQYQLAMDALALDVADVDGVFGHILSATKIKGALAPRAEVARARSESLIRLSYLNRIEDRLDEVTDGALLIPVGKKTMTRRRIEKTIQEGVKEAQEILEKEKLPEFLSQFDALADGRPLPMPLAEQLQANSYAIHNVGNPDVSLNPATVLYTLAGLTIFVKNHLEEEGDPDYGYDAFFLDLINAAVIEDYAALPAKPAEEKRHRIPFFGKKSEHEEMHGVFKRIQKRFAKGKEAKKETPKPSEETEQNQAK